MELNLLDFVIWVMMNIIFIVIEKRNDGNYFIGCLCFIMNIIYIIVFVYPIDLDWIDLSKYINITL